MCSIWLGAPRFEPQVQVQKKTKPAPHTRFGSLATPHPKPWVRFGFSAGSGCLRTEPWPVYGEHRNRHIPNSMRATSVSNMMCSQKMWVQVFFSPYMCIVYIINFSRTPWNPHWHSQGDCSTISYHEVAKKERGIIPSCTVCKNSCHIFLTQC